MSWYEKKFSLSKSLEILSLLTLVLIDFIGIENRQRVTVDAPEREFKTLQSQQSDAERFKDAEPFGFRCRKCGIEGHFVGLNGNTVSLLFLLAFILGY